VKAFCEGLLWKYSVKSFCKGILCINNFSSTCLQLTVLQFVRFVSAVMTVHWKTFELQGWEVDAEDVTLRSATRPHHHYNSAC
jgi:hypothetical protein